MERSALIAYNLRGHCTKGHSCKGPIREALMLIFSGTGAVSLKEVEEKAKEVE